MAVQKTVQIGHPALRTTNTEVREFGSDSLSQIVTDLADTMRQAGLIGMATPQIEKNIQLFITEPRETIRRPKDQADQLRVFINPRIIDVSNQEIELFEGCGSVLNGQLFGPVVRPQMVTIEAYDLEGKKFRYTADGILGRVILHEFDHLHMTEYLSKVSDYTRMMTLEHYLENVVSNKKHQEMSQITIKKLEYL